MPHVNRLYFIHHPVASPPSTVGMAINKAIMAIHLIPIAPLVIPTPVLLMICPLLPHNLWLFSLKVHVKTRVHCCRLFRVIEHNVICTALPFFFTHTTQSITRICYRINPPQSRCSKTRRRFWNDHTTITKINVPELPRSWRVLLRRISRPVADCVKNYVQE